MPARDVKVLSRGLMHVCGDKHLAAAGQGDELSMKYKRVSVEDAEQGWNEVYEASLDSCMHGMYCQQGTDCQVKASVDARIRSSCSSIPIWHTLKFSVRVPNSRTITSA